MIDIEKYIDAFEESACKPNYDIKAGVIAVIKLAYIEGYNDGQHESHILSAEDALQASLGDEKGLVDDENTPN